jgi:hypothetical protein
VPLLAFDATAAATAAHGLTAGTVLRLILAAFAVLVLRALFVLLRPTKRCGKCDGRRNYRKGKRLVRCKRCQDGRVYRFGATAVHRFWWSVVTGPWLERRREASRVSREQGSK